MHPNDSVADAGRLKASCFDLATACLPATVVPPQRVLQAYADDASLVVEIFVHVLHTFEGVQAVCLNTNALKSIVGCCPASTVPLVSAQQEINDDATMETFVTVLNKNEEYNDCDLSKRSLRSEMFSTYGSALVSVPDTVHSIVGCESALFDSQSRRSWDRRLVSIRDFIIY